MWIGSSIRNSPTSLSNILIGVDLNGLLLLFCTHYTIRGGASRDSTDCGTFSVGDNNTTSSAHWAISAALS